MRCLSVYQCPSRKEEGWTDLKSSLGVSAVLSSIFSTAASKAGDAFALHDPSQQDEGALSSPTTGNTDFTPRYITVPYPFSRQESLRHVFDEVRIR